ncbi:MAG: efflux RND transporter periplasmic adaptor subunit, partial [Alphaproteobacteria bacterium]|nr:efflux RND transporter periplasmic adaptor subunit [Alphaproteobacteria bacterium]
MLKCFQTKFNKGHIRKTVVLLALGISLTFSAFSQTGSSMAQGRPSPVAVDEVEVIEMSQTMPVLGRLVAQQRTTLAALVEGPVLDVTVQVGDLVAAGDVLIKLDDSILTQNLRFAEAKLKQSRANLLTAENAHALSVQEIARLQKLSGSAAFSPARLEDKQLEESRLKAMIEVARATVTASEAEVQLARINLKRTNIKAPFNGIVVAKHTEAGSYLSKGSQVLAILNHEELEVEADVPSNRLSGLEVGRVVELKMGDSGSG